jgi:hypothetical protein
VAKHERGDAVESSTHGNAAARWMEGKKVGGFGKPGKLS